MPNLNTDLPDASPNKDGASLKEVVDYRIDLYKERLNVAIPAKIIKFNPETQLAKVKPVLYEAYKDGVNQPFADINNVPVIFPSSGNHSLTFPVKEGDECLLIFSQRNFDTWFTSSRSPSLASTQRYHDYNDAIAILGLKSKKNSLKASTEDIELRFDDDSGENICKIVLRPDGSLSLKNNDTEVNVLPDGKVSVKNSQEELISLLSDLIDTLSNTTVNTIYGQSILNSKPTLQELKTKLDTFKE